MLNLRIPISITGLAVAAVAIGGYHHFVEPLFPATEMDLFWIVYVASGFNLYGYFFRFSSLVQPSAYRQRYQDLKEVASWTWTRLQENRHLLAKYGRKAVQEDPLLVAMWICYGIGILGESYVGGVAYVPVGTCIVLIVGRELRDFTNSSAEEDAR